MQPSVHRAVLRVKRGHAIGEGGSVNAMMSLNSKVLSLLSSSSLKGNLLHSIVSIPKKPPYFIF